MKKKNGKAIHKTCFYVSTIWMTTSNNQVWFYREKKLQRQISPLRIDQMVSDLLAWRVWLERTYSLSAVLVTGAGPRRLTIYTPGRPQTPTPSRTSVVLWLFGRRAEPSHNPNGTSFKTRLFPALHVPSLESLGHMPSDVITAQQLSRTAYRCGFLPSPLRSFFSLLLLSYAWFGSVSRLSGGSGSDAPMSQEASEGAACSTAHASSAYGEQRSLCFASLHSFIPLPLSDSAALSLNSFNRLPCCSCLPLSRES
ncbi:hypothetical protein PAMP_014407 [Pampus punctatissimus]